MPARLSTIDELTRPDHSFLDVDDECHYLGDYTSRKGYAFSEMNNLINNLRKPMERRGKPEWKHKESAILTCGQKLKESLNEEWLADATLVPIPCSKTWNDPEYDDRLPRILQELCRGEDYDLRELVYMTRNVVQSHLAEQRVSIEELMSSMAIDERIVKPKPQHFGIFDDVLTTGRHFKAVQRILARRFPGVPVVGIFVARRAPESVLL